MPDYFRAGLAAAALALLAALPAAAQVTITLTNGQTSTTAYTLSPYGTLTIASGSATQSGVLSGSGYLNKTGAGTVTLSGANTYSGGTTLTGGTLVLGSTGALGSSGTISFAGGTLQFSASNTTDYSARFSTAANQLYSFNANSGVVTFNSALNSSGGSLNKLGSGILILTAANTYTGSTTVSEGNLTLSSNGSIASSASVTIASGATVDMGNRVLSFRNLFGSGDLLLGTAGNLTITTDSSSNFAGTISGGSAASLTMAGTGILTLSGTNYYAGGTTLSAGTLVVDSDQALTSPITFNGGTLRYGNTTNDYSAFFSTAAAQAFRLDTNGKSVQVNLLSPGASLTKLGAGTLTINGVPYLTSGISVEAGTLALLPGGKDFSTASTIAIAANATLALQGNSWSMEALGGTGNVVFSNGSILRLGLNDVSSTFAGTLSGTGPLYKLGTGTLTLSGSNTYTGGTRLYGGTLSLGSTNALGSSGTISFYGGTLQFSANNATDCSARFSSAASQLYRIDTNSQAVTFASALSSSGGSLTKLGAGTLTLNAANTYSGGTTVADGILALGSSGSIGSTAAVTIASGASLNLNNHNLSSASLSGTGSLMLGTGNLSITDGSGADFSGVISGSGSLSKSGSGSQTLSGTNTYSGVTMVDAGTLILGSDSALGTSTAITITTSATLDLNGHALSRSALAGSGSVALTDANLSLGTGNASSTLAASLSGNGSLTKLGTGTLILSGTNTFTGGTNFAEGIVSLGSAAALGSAGLLHFGGGTLQFSAGNTTDYSARFSTATGQFYRIDTNGQTVTLASAFSSEGGSLTKLGAGTLTLAADSAYSGTMSIEAGTLSLGSATALGSSSTITIATGATLDLNGHDLTLATLLGSGNATFSAAVLSLGAADASSTVANILSGSGSLTKIGSGTLTLTGDNTYTGATTIDAGTLVLGYDRALGFTSSITIASGATLDLDGRDAVLSAVSGAGDVALSGGGTLSLGSGDTGATFSGRLSGNGQLRKIGTGTLVLTGANVHTGGTIFAGGLVSLGSADALGTTGALSFSGGTLQFSADNTTDYSARFSSAANQQYRIDTNGQSVTFASSLASSNGSLTKLGAGNLTLGSANTYTGATSIDTGTLTLGSAGALGATSSVTIASGATLDLNGHDLARSELAGTGQVALNGATLTLGSGDVSSTFGGSISGNGQLTKTGSGTLVLAGANTYAGATLIEAGTLTLGHDRALDYASPVTINGGATLDLNGHWLSLSSLTGSGQIALSGAMLGLGVDTDRVFKGTISGAGQLAKFGTGTLTLTGTNTYSGSDSYYNISTLLWEGTLSLGSADALGTSGYIDFRGGTLQFTAENTTDYSARISLGGYGPVRIDTNGQNVTFASSCLGASREINKLGAGTLTLGGEYLGPAIVSVEAGTLVLGHDNAIGSGIQLGIASGATLDLNRHDLNASILWGSGNLSLSGATLTVGQGDQTLNFEGSLAGEGHLKKIGSGTLTLSGNSTYSGDTLLQGGTLRINNPSGSAFGSGAVTVSADGTLAGAGSFTGPLQLNGLISPGNSPGIMATGSETWAGGATYVWEINNAAGTAGINWDRLDITGSLNIAATAGNPFTLQLTSLTAGNAAGDVANFNSAGNYAYTIATASTGITNFSADRFTIDTGSFSNAFSGTWSVALAGNNLNLVYTAAVPEPATVALVAGAAALLVAGIRRRGRR